MTGTEAAGFRLSATAARQWRERFGTDPEAALRASRRCRRLERWPDIQVYLHAPTGGAFLVRPTAGSLVAVSAVYSLGLENYAANDKRQNRKKNPDAKRWTKQRRRERKVRCGEPEGE